MRKGTKRLTAAWTSVVWYGAYAGACHAQSGDNAPDPPIGNTASTIWMLVKVVLFLIIIIGIFLLIMKGVAQKNKLFHAGRSIRPVGGLGLGPNKSIQVVQIGSSLFILGVGNDVELISKIDDPEEIQNILDHMQSGSTDFKGFPTLGEWLRRIVKPTSPSEELEVTPSFQAVFQEKMRRVANRQKKVEELISHDPNSRNGRFEDHHEE